MNINDNIITAETMPLTNSQPTLAQLPLIRRGGVALGGGHPVEKN